MKTATAILFAVCFSSLILTGLAAGDTFDITITDAASSSTNFPATITNVKTNTITFKATASATQVQVTGISANTAATALTDNTFTLAFTGGFPVKSTIVAAVDANANTNKATDFIILNLATGNQIITVTGSTTGASSAASGSSQQSALTATNKCGDYYYNGASGVVSIYFTDACQAIVQQVAGVYGALQYNEAASSITSTQQNNIQTAITKLANTANGVTSAVATIVGSSTGSTIFYYEVNGLTSSQQNTDVTNAIQNAINAKTLKVDGVTLLNGFASPVSTSASASTSAPSSTVASSIAAATPKAHNRMVVVVGIFSTITAALFGLAF